MGGSIFSVGNTSKPNINSSNAGPTEIKTGQPFDKAEFERLNQEKDIHSGKFKPEEAYAAVEIQNSLGGQLARVQESDGSLADYIFTSGPNKGKTVDFMFTTANGTAKEIDGMNKFFNNNWDSNVDNLNQHLKKSDIVPLDFRKLSFENQQRLMNYINTLPKEEQKKIVIMR